MKTPKESLEGILVRVGGLQNSLRSGEEYNLVIDTNVISLFSLTGFLKKLFFYKIGNLHVYPNIKVITSKYQIDICSSIATVTISKEFLTNNKKLVWLSK